MKIKLVTPKPVIHMWFTQVMKEGVRLSMNSVDKSSSEVFMKNPQYTKGELDCSDGHLYTNIDPKDIALARKLNKGGIASGHEKFMAMIPCLISLKMSRKMWQEFDTHTVGVRKHSESTMHTITKQNLSMDDFELDSNLCGGDTSYMFSKILIYKFLEFADEMKNLFKRKKITESEYRNILKNTLPESFLQERLVSLNYAVLKTIYKQRYNHREVSWQRFCEFIKTEMPYSDLITQGIE